MLRLILGSGKHWEKDPRHDDIFVDIKPFYGVEVVHDLNKTPWPFENNSVDFISAIHLVEHLDNLVEFMNECHRILKVGGFIYIETPLAGANPDLEFSDPTHKRCYRLHTFTNYFTRLGVHNFGYTELMWNFHCTEIINGNVIKVEGSPIK